MRHATAWVVLWGLTTAGCSGDVRGPRAGDAPASGGRDRGAAGGPEMDSGPEQLGSGGSGPAAGYPNGPYGEGNPQVGDVIEDLKLQGFVSEAGGGLATTQPFSETSLARLRDSGARYLLIHTATAWCTSCRAAADDMGLRGEEVLDAGGAVLELLLDGLGTNQDPTEREIAAWIEAHDLSVTTAGPREDRVRKVFPSREYAYIVELGTMTVLWREEGLYASPTVAAVGIDRMLQAYLD